jgi:DnaJ-class molecular chaperone
MTDYYSTLGVGKTATQDEIKRAYRKLASQHHPDKGGSKEEFQRVQQAYDTLGNDQKRSQYDNPAQQFSNAGFPGGFHFNFGPGGFNFSDVFGQFQQQHAQQRSMVRMSLWVRLHDIAVGGRRPISVATTSGASAIEIDIPMGINDGDTIRYPGLAPGGGDLAIQFRIHPDPRWSRDGLDLIVEESISIWDLVLGTDLNITDITGKSLAIKVPAETQPRTILRLRGHGLRTSQGRAGDLLVKVSANMPAKIHPDLIEAIKKYRD